MITPKPILDDIYDARTVVAVCCICGHDRDLRFGVCFTCSAQVDGKVVAQSDTTRTHKLWDSKNPGNCWFVKEPAQSGPHAHERCSTRSEVNGVA